MFRPIPDHGRPSITSQVPRGHSQRPTRDLLSPPRLRHLLRRPAPTTAHAPNHAAIAPTTATASSNGSNLAQPAPSARPRPARPARTRRNLGLFRPTPFGETTHCRRRRLFRRPAIPLLDELASADQPTLRTTPPPPPPASPAPRPSSRIPAFPARRLDVYRHGLFSLHIGANKHSRYRPVITPHAFTHDPDLQSRARAFIRRELLVLDALDPPPAPVPGAADTSGPSSHRSRDHLSPTASPPINSSI
ncbi:unnamed protein product [Parascedosporium putredinis]|uniref:Uncharacterized protein n=1 Tax=Parascedosporium putredinis TaxID=1442378 RepID=A0A9P1H8M9_9PEZI|nr:unnamed protein product [Parascedosporium putredinis]CAI7999994.1 unnamed protein product [Parascedosporium putredinis]